MNLAIGEININIDTIPKTILEQYSKLSKEYSFRIDKDGNYTKGEKIPPIPMKHTYFERGKKYDCYINEYEFETLIKTIEKGLIKNEDLSTLKLAELQSYLISYSKGFNVGYFKFQQYVCFGNNLDLNNPDIIYWIYERVCGIFVERGSILSKKINLNNGTPISYIDKDLFYKMGVEAGEYYRAWEIILKHPLRFVHLFDREIPKENSNILELNPHPNIFKNLQSFKFFEELRQLTVKDRTKSADYGFIFHHLKTKSIGAINEFVTGPIFINFLNNNYDANIFERKLPFKKPAYKIVLFEELLKKYKPIL